MIHIFTLAWDPEAGDIRITRTLPLEEVQQLVNKLVAQEAVTQALAEAKQRKSTKAKEAKAS